MWEHACHSEYVEVRERPEGVSSFLSIYGSQRSDSLRASCQAWWQEPLHTEPLTGVVFVFWFCLLIFDTGELSSDDDSVVTKYWLFKLVFSGPMWEPNEVVASEMPGHLLRWERETWEFLETPRPSSLAHTAGRDETLSQTSWVGRNDTCASCTLSHTCVHRLKHV